MEKNFIIYLWTKWCTRNIPIKIRWGDVTNVPLKDATHIYMYLFPKIMDKLLPKFQKECAIGTRIISCDFVFSKLSPDEVIELPVVKDPLCKKLYVYVLK